MLEFYCKKGDYRMLKYLETVYYRINQLTPKYWLYYFLNAWFVLLLFLPVLKVIQPYSILGLIVGYAFELLLLLKISDICYKEYVENEHK